MNTIGKREIKFRAWDGIRMHRWGAGVITIDHQLNVTTVPAGRYLPRGTVLMQYTGLTDKNGREIYEGDICRVDHLDPRYTVENTLISWNERDAGWSVGIGLPSEVDWSHEVVGNIYENPELLAAAEERA